MGKKMSQSDIYRIINMYKSGFEIEEIMEVMNCHRVTVRRYLVSAGLMEISKKEKAQRERAFGRVSEDIQNDNFGFAVGDRVLYHFNSQEGSGKGKILAITKHYFLIKTDKGYNTCVLKVDIGTEGGAILRKLVSK